MTCPAIMCPGVCATAVGRRLDVQLGVQADPGYGFAGWLGACSGEITSVLQ